MPQDQNKAASRLAPDARTTDEHAGSSTGPRPEVVIFRNNLFRPSETFITAQAQALRRFRPVYLGRFRFGPPPSSSVSLSLAGSPAEGPLWPALWHLASRSPRDLQHLLRERQPRLVHAHFGIDGVYALPLAQRLGVPLITSFHGYDATLSTAALLTSPAWAQYPLFRRRLARQGDLFLCASRFLRDRVLAMGFPAERSLVHYIGIDVGNIRPREATEEQSVIVHVARLVEVKGTEYLLRAVARLRGAAAGCRLMVIGDGPCRPQLERLSRELGIAGRVDFLGARPHDEVMARLRAAAVLVLPSIRTATGRTEGLGMVLLEAAATGVAVIGTRLGGIPEVVRDGETGWLVDERSDEDLARRLAELLADHEQRARMGQAGRAWIARNFDMVEQTRRLEALYQELIDRRADAQEGGAA